MPLRIAAAAASRGIAIVIVGLGLCGHAVAGQSPAIGMNGGTEVQVNCPEGQWLVGFEPWVKGWMHHLAPLCAALDNAAVQGGPPAPVGTQTLWIETGNPPLLPLKRLEVPGSLGMGSSAEGDPRAKLLCPDRTLLVGLDIYFAQANGMVGLIDLLCRPSVGIELQRVTLGSHRVMVNGREQYSPANRTMCPEGEVARGIHGRSGRYVDKLGLSCAPMATSADTDLSSTRRMRSGERLEAPASRRDGRFLPRLPSIERRASPTVGAPDAEPPQDPPPAQ